MPNNDVPSPRVLRLRSLQAAIHEDWLSVKKNADTIQSILKKTTSDSMRAAAVATYLLRIYSGLERLIQRIAEELNGGIPHGSAWHRELIEMMTRPIPGIRPRVITNELKEKLDEYRRFRHLLNHNYAVELEWSKIKPLVDNLTGFLDEFDGELNNFHRFIDELCDSI